ncbi:transcription factor IIIB 50 kDa subunit, partial [Pyxicephalus adspersus]|uniref:transcription factor IIIB 50 kDa subunit n=1 Tax=Pyxicephalus adspersus TaxID=30357 RepID=UPI003B59B9A3
NSLNHHHAACKVGIPGQSIEALGLSEFIFVTLGVTSGVTNIFLYSFRLLQNSPPAPPEYAENLDKVLERTLKTLELAGELWLITGRHPIPIITAAAFLSWQSLSPAQRLSCTVSKFCQLCEMEVPPPTKKRKKEILEICLNLAKQLPWLKMVFLKKKTVIQHLGDILRHWPYLLRKALASAELSGAENSGTAEQASQANPFLPPCMKKTKKRRYESTFTESQQVITGDEDISDSEIDEYLRTPAEIKEIQELQAKLSRTLNQR